MLMIISIYLNYTAGSAGCMFVSDDIFRFPLHNISIIYTAELYTIYQAFLASDDKPRLLDVLKLS
jgi:hypothetical protein